MKLKINPIVDGEDISSELSGRIIFSKGDNFGEELWWADEDEETAEVVGIDFYCGPETKEGYVEDGYDCGLYDQLEDLFKFLGLKAEIGAAENYHQVAVPVEMEPEECWDIVKSVLIEAGAVEKFF